MKSTVRRKCASCGRKKYLCDMYVVHYPLIARIAILCTDCYDETNMFCLKLSPQGDKNND